MMWKDINPILRKLYNDIAESHSDTVSYGTAESAKKNAMDAIEMLHDALKLATEYQSPETQRLLEIGRATKRAFKNCGYITGMDYNIYLEDALLKWHKELEATQ